MSLIECELEDIYVIDDKYDDDVLKIQKLETIINTQSKKFKNVQFKKKLGSGAFGQVYSADCEYENKTIQVAVKYIGIENDVMKEHYGMDDEYTVFEKMSKLNLSPCLYEGLRFKTKNSKEKKGMLLIMEKYDFDCRTVMVSNDFTYEVKRDVLYQMIKIIFQMVSNGFSCIDAKLLNFMFKKEGQIVKMIDFGEYCTCDTKKIHEEIDFIEKCRIFTTENNTDKNNKYAFENSEIIFNLIIIKHMMFTAQIQYFLNRYYDFDEEKREYTTILKNKSKEDQFKRNQIYWSTLMLNREITNLPIFKSFLNPDEKKFRCFFAELINYSNQYGFIRNRQLTHYCAHSLAYDVKVSGPIRNYTARDLKKIIMLSGLNDDSFGKAIKKFMDYGEKEFKEYIEEASSSK